MLVFIYFKKFGWSKIDNFDLISINKNVFWFNVSVHNIVTIAVLDNLKQLP